MSLLKKNPSECPLVEVRDVQTWFPVKTGLFGRTSRYIKAVDRVSLQINSGEIVALVGESGCGKSTFINLVMRFYDPAHGRILLDGIDISTIKLHSLRTAIGESLDNDTIEVQTDDTFFTTGTIIQNGLSIIVADGYTPTVDMNNLSGLHVRGVNE